MVLVGVSSGRHGVSEGSVDMRGVDVWRRERLEITKGAKSVRVMMTLETRSFVRVTLIKPYSSPEHVSR